jgi:hypothetical protein
LHTTDRALPTSSPWRHSESGAGHPSHWGGFCEGGFFTFGGVKFYICNCKWGKQDHAPREELEEARRLIRDKCGEGASGWVFSRLWDKGYNIAPCDETIGRDGTELCPEWCNMPFCWGNDPETECGHNGYDGHPEWEHSPEDDEPLTWPGHESKDESGNEPEDASDED